MSDATLLKTSCTFEYDSTNSRHILRLFWENNGQQIDIHVMMRANQYYHLAINGTDLGSIKSQALAFYNFEEGQTIKARIRNANTGVWTDEIILYNQSEPTNLHENEYYPSYYPTVHHQWVWNPVSESWEGQVGSCLANTLACVKEVFEWKKEGKLKQVSTGWIYGNRKAEHYQGEGLDPNQALEMMVEDGSPSYTSIPQNADLPYWFPYPDNYFTDDWQDNIGAKTLVQLNRDNLLEEAKQNRFRSYENKTIEFKNNNIIKQAIKDNGAVIVIMKVSYNFNNVDSTGMIPQADTINVNGAHALVIIGWKMINGKTHWLVQNSWDTWWGDEGRGWLPCDHVGLFDFYIVHDILQRPSNFYWTKPKTQNDIGILSSEWNELADRVNSFRDYKSLPQVNITSINSNSYLMANYFNEIRNAIAEMQPTTPPPDVVQGVSEVGETNATQVTPDILNNLQDSLNSIS